MRYVGSLAVALTFTLASPALAQEKTVSLSLTITEAQTVINAVGEHPWKDVNPVMQKMIAQVNAQLIPPPAKPTPAPAETKPEPPSKDAPSDEKPKLDDPSEK